MNTLLADPGFELDTASDVGGWSTAGVGGRANDEPREGSYHGFVSSYRTTPTDTPTASTLSAQVSVSSGTAYALSTWVSLESGACGISLAYRCPATATADTVLTTLAATDIKSGWNFLSGSFTATAANASFRVVTNTADFGTWYVDTCAMSPSGTRKIELSELPVRTVLETVRSHLPAEIDEINDAHSDITLTKPTTSGYYNRPKAEITGGDVHVEVYESGFDIRSPYQDVDANRATYDIPITVRLTAFNRANLSASDMMNALRRYEAALGRVFLENPYLDRQEDAVQVCRIDSVTPFWELAGADTEAVRKVSVALGLTVSVEECGG